jgi:pimeloyl-ACP methyl ester carboxylesterase
LKKYLPIFFFFVIFSGSLKSEPGQLIDYTHQSTMTQDDVNFFLWFSGFDPVADYGISVYDIHYESHSEYGIVDTLAGLVIIPHSLTEAFPIFTYQHGTVILDSQAPSITGMSADNVEILFISLITAPSGFITVIPDYTGIGDPDKYHPYIIANSHTQALVNMIRGVKQLSFELEGNDGFQFNDQLFLVGYSDGGYATLASQKGIQIDYSDELSVTASFPMAGPYDLSGTMVDYFLSEPEYTQPYYVPYVLTSHLWYYQGLDVDFADYFEPFWADTLTSLFDGTHSGSEINELMPENPLDILLDDVLEEFENDEDHFFRQSLEENTLLDWVPESPTYFYHGMGDDIVPYENAQVAYDTFVNNGAPDVNLELFPEALGGHSDVAVTCLLAGYTVILEYQRISPKGDMNSDGLITIEDVNALMESILIENDLTEFQWWAGHLDADNSHSIFDLLGASDAVAN